MTEQAEQLRPNDTDLRSIRIDRIHLRARSLLAVVISCVCLYYWGWRILRPWDPLGAISLITRADAISVIVKCLLLLVVVAIFAEVMLSGRIKLFGLFAASLGMLLPLLRGSGIDMLFVELGADIGVEDSDIIWLYLLFESILWSVVLGLLSLISWKIGNWLSEGAENYTRDNTRDNVEGNARDSIKDNSKKDHKKDYAQGYKEDAKGKGRSRETLVYILGLLITAVLAVFFISIFAQSSERLQVLFAAIVGCFLATLLADQIIPLDRFPYQLPSIFIVAIVAYGYTYLNPDRPAGFELIVQIPPNNLARLLPIEYIFAGSVGCILGIWYSFKLRARLE